MRLGFDSDDVVLMNVKGGDLHMRRESHLDQIVIVHLLFAENQFLVTHRERVLCNERKKRGLNRFRYVLLDIHHRCAGADVEGDEFKVEIELDQHCQRVP